MTTDTVPADSVKASGSKRQAWHWCPRLPISVAPVVDWPLRPVAAAKFLFGKGFVFSTSSIFVALAVLTWFYWLPEKTRWATFSFDWVLQVGLINMLLLGAVAGGLHLYFHTFRVQGRERKFEAKELDRNSKKFLFNNQVWDNIFWSCVSGIPLVTAWQALLMWSFANGYAPWLSWTDNPVWFVLLFPLTAMWSSMHFYWIHRLIHHPRLFKRVHALHHRNINTGPWTGISMHPLEHLLYFSTVLIHFVVPTHPLHLLYHVYLQILSPPATHSGFADLQIRGRPVFGLGDFFHQLHHKYFDCNYGTGLMPWDKWFGSFHNGTEEATARLRRYQMQRRGSPSKA